MTEIFRRVEWRTDG